MDDYSKDLKTNTYQKYVNEFRSVREVAKTKSEVLLYRFKIKFYKRLDFSKKI